MPKLSCAEAQGTCALGKILYNTFVMSNFNYCPLLWIYHGKTSSNQVDRVQKRALRILHNDFNTQFEVLLEITDERKVHTKNLQKLMLQIFKCFSEENPSFMWTFFERKHIKYELRSKTNVSMYADDTSLCYQSHDMTRLNEAINSDLAKLDKWLQGNKLSLNVAKTHSLSISSKQKHNSILKGQNENLILKIRDNELEVVKKTKYLGLQIDCSLDWKEQIKAVSAKVSRAIGFLKHAKSFLPKETFQTLYTGIVEPHFRYCCSVWGCAGSSEINQLQKLQKRAARIITNSSFDAPSRPLIEKLGWKTDDQLISSESKTMVFKSLNELAPQYLCDLFTRKSLYSSYSLRNTGTDLRLPMKRSTNDQKCFSYRGAKLWNSLSAESKQATSLYSFKKTI